METKVDRIMLIDDNEIDNFISQRVIGKSNFAKEVTVFNSAIEALGFLKHPHNNDLLPDLIFLDIQMPFMDGFGFLKEFNKLAHHVRQKCKIIVLSSSYHSLDVHNILQQPYVLDFITKPLSNSVLDRLKLHSGSRSSHA